MVESLIAFFRVGGYLQSSKGVKIQDKLMKKLVTECELNCTV